MLNKSIFVFLFFLCQLTLGRAEVKLPAILGDNMVLQQRTKVKLWGTCKPFGQVMIHPSWDERIYTVIADGKGNWSTHIRTAKAGGPYQIFFSDGEELVLKNILLGEVWVCAGQSNMVMPVKGYTGQPVVNSEQLVATADKYPDIRFFQVPKTMSGKPLVDCKGDWKASSSQNVPEFSAIAFQYARILNEKLKVPIGIISSSWGSTAIQSWMSTQNLQHFPEVTISSNSDTLKIPAKDPENVTSVLFNAMVMPVANYTIKGFLWYQGESNAKHPELYQKLFPAMVKEWRELWGLGKLPFYYAQVAPFGYKSPINIALLREVQLHARIPNSGMVVSIDAGKEKFIHPPDKTIISQRFSYWALSKTYQQNNINFKSPELKAAKFSRASVMLTFKNVCKGLKFKDSVSVNFEVAGNDHMFYPAMAKIAGKSQVRVSCEKVQKPVAIRYAFGNWVEGDLFNSAGLPASSFRTDQYSENEFSSVK